MKCLSNFGKFTDGALENKCHVIINSLTGNASFPNPIPALATIEAASAAYSASLVEAGTGNRAAIALKNMRRAELTELLLQLCKWVNFLGNGQPELLLTTGFDVSKERVPTVITVPQNLQVENGDNSGQLLLSVTRVKGAASYLYEYTTDSTLAPNTGLPHRPVKANLSSATWCRARCITAVWVLLVLMVSCCTARFLAAWLFKFCIQFLSLQLIG